MNFNEVSNYTMAFGIGSLGPLEIGALAVILIILFGPKRLPGLGKSLGEAIRSFRKGISESSGEEEKTLEASKKNPSQDSKES